MLIFPRLINAMGSPLLAGSAGVWPRGESGCGYLTIRRVAGVTLGLLVLMAVAGWVLWWVVPPAAGVALARNVGLGAGVLAFSLAFAASLKPQ